VIIIEEVIEAKGKYGAYVIIKFVKTEGDVIKNGLATGSKAIMDKVLEAESKDMLPIAGEIVKRDNWYDIV